MSVRARLKVIYYTGLAGKAKILQKATHGTKITGRARIEQSVSIYAIQLHAILLWLFQANTSLQGRIETLGENKKTMRGRIKALGSADISVLSRILTTKVKSLLSQGRLKQADITNALSSLARIETSGLSSSLSSKARLSKENLVLIELLARIFREESRQKQSKARVLQAGISNAISSQARIKQADLANFLTLRADIKSLGTSKKLTFKARLSKEESVLKQIRGRIQTESTKLTELRARLQQLDLASLLTSQTRIKQSDLSSVLSSKANIFNTMNALLSARAHVSMEGAVNIKMGGRVQILGLNKAISVLSKILRLESSIESLQARILKIESKKLQSQARIFATTDHLLTSKGRIEQSDIVGNLTSQARIRQSGSSSILISQAEVKRLGTVGKFTSQGRLKQGDLINILTGKGRLEQLDNTTKLALEARLKELEKTGKISSEARLLRSELVLDELKGRIKTEETKLTELKARLQQADLTEVLTSQARIEQSNLSKILSSRADIFKMIAALLSARAYVSVEGTKLSKIRGRLRTSGINKIIKILSRILKLESNISLLQARILSIESGMLQLRANIFGTSESILASKGRLGQPGDIRFTSKGRIEQLGESKVSSEGRIEQTAFGMVQSQARLKTEETKLLQLQGRLSKLENRLIQLRARIDIEEMYGLIQLRSRILTLGNSNVLTSLARVEQSDILNFLSSEGRIQQAMDVLTSIKANIETEEVTGKVQIGSRIKITDIENTIQALGRIITAGGKSFLSKGRLKQTVDTLLQAKARIEEYEQTSEVEIGSRIKIADIENVIEILGRILKTQENITQLQGRVETLSESILSIKSNIKATESTLLSSRIRIRQPGTVGILEPRARIQQFGTETTLDSEARILNETIAKLQAQAKILILSGVTIQSKANLKNAVSRLESMKADIKQFGTENITSSKARIVMAGEWSEIWDLTIEIGTETRYLDTKARIKIAGILNNILLLARIHAPIYASLSEQTRIKNIGLSVLSERGRIEHPGESSAIQLKAALSHLRGSLLWPKARIYGINTSRLSKRARIYTLAKSTILKIRARIHSYIINKYISGRGRIRVINSNILLQKAKIKYLSSKQVSMRAYIINLSLGNTIALSINLETQKVETCGLLTELQWEAVTTLATNSFLEKSNQVTFAVTTTLQKPKILGAFVQGHPLSIRL